MQGKYWRYFPSCSIGLSAFKRTSAPSIAVKVSSSKFDEIVKLEICVYQR
jgi:hypothetical protein